MEQLTKPEPQELRLDDVEESKSSAEQWTDASMADKQPQSLILQDRNGSGADVNVQLLQFLYGGLQMNSSPAKCCTSEFSLAE